jgi:hypothetical protein
VTFVIASSDVIPTRRLYHIFDMTGISWYS